MKKILTLMVLALMVTVFVACSNNDANNGNATGNKGDTIVIQFVSTIPGAQINGNSRIEIAKGSKLNLEQVPQVSLKGHEFIGWAYDEEGKRLWDPDKDVFENGAVLFAILVEGSNAMAKVTIDMQDGVPISHTVLKGRTIDPSIFPKLEKEGYKLVGWAYDKSGNKFWKAEDRITADVTLYPIWDYSESVFIQFRGNSKDVVFEGAVNAKLKKGASLDESLVPSAIRDGYEFKCWAYDTSGNNPWNIEDVFNQNTILYAVWELESNTAGPNDSMDNSGTTDNSGNTGDSGNLDNSGGAGNEDNTGGNAGNEPTPPVITDGITVEFNTGVGYFTDITLYEAYIQRGSRLGSFPTPIHDNEAMLFDGWFKDSEYKIPASLSDKYMENTVLYAHWIERAQCTDGTYNHLYTGWDVDQKASCTKPGTYARYCEDCNDKQEKDGDPALGHQFSPWQEVFMARKRTCQRLGCGESEFEDFENLTVSSLGNRPAGQIEGSSDKFYAAAPFTNLINGRWDEGYGEHVSPKGNGTAYIQFNLIAPTAIDRVYFKATGSVSVNIYVQYEGETEWALIGICGSTPDKETTPYAVNNDERNIVAIKFVEDNPQNGAAIWQEVAFVKVP